MFKKYSMIELKDYKGIMYASAKDLYSLLGIKKDFSTWIRKNIQRAILECEKDFLTLKGESTGGRPSIDYLLTKESALTLIALSSGQYAKDVRLELIKAFKEKQTGVLLNADQVAALTDVVKAMTLVSVQKNAEQKHYLALNKPSDWWQYRANLLGYSKESLISALEKINKQYHSQKTALMQLDKVEIIRTGVIDLLIALGRNKEYALNVAEFAKIIAEKNNYHLQIWDDTKPNPLGLKSSEILERQKIGNKLIK